MASRRRAGFALVTALALASSWAGAGASPARAITPLSFSPDPVDFGSVQFGQSASTDVTVTNQSGADTTINVVEIGVNSNEFSITGGDCVAPKLLSNGASCSVKVTFTPNTVGSLEAGTLHVSTVEGANQSDGLSGTGLSGVTGGGTLDFGDQPKNSTSASQNAIVTNSGTGAVTPVSSAITGTNSGDFIKGTDTCSGQSVAASGTCSISVAFHPTALGARTATLTLTLPAPYPAITWTLTGNGLTPNSSVVWKTTYNAAPNYTWNFGSAMARSVKSGVQQLHVISQTDVVGGNFVSDTGPYLGVMYTHSTTGSTWTSAKRLNPTTQHGSRIAIDASGAYVYAVWVSLKHYINPVGTEPRTLYLRVNGNYGASSAWKSIKRITSLTGRVDFPTVAASGKYVLIAWTDSATGAVNVARSADYGSTFKITRLGTTTYANSYGYKGLPKVSFSGAYAIVAWVANTSGAISTRISSNYGSTWGTKQTPVSSSYAASGDGFGATIRGSRAAVTWSDANGVKVRVRTSSWATPRVVATASGNDQYEPRVALQGSTLLAVSWSEYSSSSNEPLLWAESPNNGAAFYQPQAIADNSVAIHSANEIPSVLWISTGTRIVSWNGFDSGDNNYRIYFRSGTGTPTGMLKSAPLTTSMVWSPSTRLHSEDRAAAR